MDIDKVSLLGFKFSKNGKFIGWSSFFNMESEEHLKASEDLPFPTGLKLKPGLIKIGTTNSVVLPPIKIDMDIRRDETDPEGDAWVYQDYATFSTDTPQAIKALATFLRQVKEQVAKGQTVTISAATLDAIIKQQLSQEALELYKELSALARKMSRESALGDIIDLIDQHNTSLDTRNNKDALMNFIVTKMIRISQDPINTVEAQSPIDDPVDIIKGLAKLQPSHKQLKSYAPGNVLDKMETLVLTLTGKENTGIAASAMKIFEALSHYYNTTLQNNPTKSDKLLFRLRLCGELQQILVNSNAHGTPQTNAMVMQALEMLDPTDDQMMTISALISLSTDNAKDPTLAKINAGPELLGLYFAGIMTGADMESLVSTMTSKTGWIINRMLGGNVFNNKAGKTLSTILSELSGDYKGLQSKILMNRFVDILGKDRFPTAKYPNEYGKWKSFCAVELKNKDLVKALATETTDIEELKPWIQAIRTARTVATTVLERRAIEEFTDFILNLYEVQTDLTSTDEKLKRGITWNPLDTIKQLNDISAETSNLRINLALNQSLPNKVADVVNYLSNFNNILRSRVSSLLSDSNWDVIKDRKVFDHELGDEVKLETYLERLKDRFPDYKLDFEKFMDDETYRTKAINAYLNVKAAFNVLDAVIHNSQYVGYMKALRTAIKANKAASIKYRFMLNNALQMLSAFGDPAQSAVKLRLFKGLERFVDYKLSNMYLLTTGKFVMIPAGTTLVSPNGREYETSTDVELRLGTAEANAIFKQWMDEVVFPELNEGKLDGLSDTANLILKTIRPVQNNGSFKKNPMVAWGLPISTMARSFSELLKVNEYKQALLELLGRTKYGNLVGNLLYYYNMIVYNGKVSQTSFTSLFEDLYAGRSFTPLNQYIDFIGLMDEEGTFYGGETNLDWNWNELLTYVAPVDNPLTSKLKYIRAKDLSTTQYVLMEALPKELRQFNGEDDLQDDPLDWTEGLQEEFSDMMDNNPDIDVDMIDVDAFDYGDVEDVGEDLYEGFKNEPNVPIWKLPGVAKRYKLFGTSADPIENLNQQSISILNYDLSPETSEDPQIIRLNGKYAVILNLDDKFDYKVYVNGVTLTLLDLVQQYNRRVDQHNAKVTNPTQRRSHVLVSDLSLILRNSILSFDSMALVDNDTNSMNRAIDKGHMYSIIEELLKDC